MNLMSCTHTHTHKSWKVMGTHPVTIRVLQRRPQRFCRRCVCVCSEYMSGKRCDTFLAVRGSRSPGVPLHLREHTNTWYTHAHTHTAGTLGCWIWPSILADGLGATLSVTIVTCSLFPLSPCLSLPLSLVLREGKWQTRFFRKGWGCIFLPLLLCVFLCVCFLAFVRCTEKIPVVFLMFGVLGRRRGPGDYLLFPNEMREDEGNRSEGFGAFFFFRVSFCCLDSGSLIFFFESA